MKRVFLIRHGEVEYPRNKEGEPLIYGPDTPLAEFGRKQIKTLGKKLKKEKIEVIYTSPYPRTIETSNILIKEFIKPVPLKIVNNLSDVDNSGFVKKELSMAEYAKLTDGGDSYSHQIFKKQESLIDICSRAIEIFEEIIKTEKKSCLAIVSHGDFLSALIWMIEQKTPTSDYRKINNYFYIAKGQAVEYYIDGNLTSAKRLRTITIPDVLKTIEKWR